MKAVSIISATLFALLTAAAGQPSAAGAQTKCGQTAAASKVEPATPPDVKSADGTAPGNGGSTGWTGGTGGAHIGTNPAGSTQHSKSWQPPTARGLDLAKKAPPAQPDC